MVAISGSGGRSSWERCVYFAETSPAENASQVSVGPIAWERSPSFYCTSPKIPYHLSQNHIEPLLEVVLRYGPESCAGTKTPPKRSRLAFQTTSGHKNTTEAFPLGLPNHLRAQKRPRNVPAQASRPPPGTKTPPKRSRTGTGPTTRGRARPARPAALSGMLRRRRPRQRKWYIGRAGWPSATCPSRF